VLLEAGMLPGAMLRNASLHFHCEHVYVKVEQTDTPFTLACSQGRALRIPGRARRRELLRGAGRSCSTREEPSGDLSLRRLVRSAHH
jgi:hypothetical protein